MLSNAAKFCRRVKSVRGAAPFRGEKAGHPSGDEEQFLHLP
jgi:hypothetical protein